MCCDLWLFPTSTDLFCWRKCVVTRSYVSNHFLFFFLSSWKQRMTDRCRRRTEDSAWPHRKVYTLHCGSGPCPHTLCCLLHFLEEDTHCCCLTHRKKNCLITGSGFGAGLVLHQQVELTCAGGCAFACGTNGFLTPHSCLLKRAVPAARTVSVAVEPQKTMSIKSFPHRDFFFMRSS